MYLPLIIALDLSVFSLQPEAHNTKLNVQDPPQFHLHYNDFIISFSLRIEFIVVLSERTDNSIIYGVSNFSICVLKVVLCHI